jgi:CDP-glycerol glycerophosphotransferase
MKTCEFGAGAIGMLKGWLFRREVWVFGSFSGKRFCDNSKYFYLYVLQNHPEIRAIWLTKSKDVKSEILLENGEVYSFYSIRGLFFSLCSKVVIRCYSLDDVGYVPYLFSSGKLLVNLSHGIPFKRADKFKRDTINLFIKKLFVFFIGREVDLVISESKESNSSLETLYKSDQIVLTGAPRTDIFFSNRKTVRAEKSIMYAPTWRDYRFDLFKEGDLKMISSFLEKEKMNLFIKWHSADKEGRPDIQGLSDRIRMAKDDVTDALLETDILITDYSSIFLDYLLLNRPMIFSAFDLEKYLEDRGFHYDYVRIIPGPRTLNWDEVLMNISEINLGVDRWKEKRDEMRDFFHTFQDGKSSDRVFKSIISQKVN